VEAKSQEGLLQVVVEQLGQASALALLGQGDLPGQGPQLFGPVPQGLLGLGPPGRFSL